MRRLTLCLLCFLMLGCNQPESTRKNVSGVSEVNKDSLISIFRDKTYLINKNFDFGYIDVKAIGKPKFSKEIRFEYENTEYNTYFKYNKAERNEIFLSVNIDIASKKTPKQKGIEPLSYQDKYLPQVCLYKVDTNSVEAFEFLGRLDYKMLTDLPNHITWYEEYFNYMERGNFLFFIKLKDSLKSQPLILTVSNPEKSTSNSIIKFTDVVWNYNIK